MQYQELGYDSLLHLNVHCYGTANMCSIGVCCGSLSGAGVT